MPWTTAGSGRYTGGNSLRNLQYEWCHYRGRSDGIVLGPWNSFEEKIAMVTVPGSRLTLIDLEGGELETPGSHEADLSMRPMQIRSVLLWL